MWPKIKKGLKVFGLGFLFFVVFALLTFPFARLGPKVSAQIERFLRASLRQPVTCSIHGFDFALPFGVKADQLSCADVGGQPFLQLQDWRFVLLPSYQTFTGAMDGGRIALTLNAGVNSGPSIIKGELNAVPMKSLSPFVSQLISRANPAVRDIRFEGNADGTFEIPLRDFSSKPGSIDLQFKGLKLPSQPTLQLIGLKELPFSKAVVKATMSGGKLNLSDVQLMSEHLSGKVEGSMELNNEFAKSVPNLTLKWNVQRSDALLSTPIGTLLASAPCPGQDSQGFCSKRITRMEDFSAY